MSILTIGSKVLLPSLIFNYLLLNSWLIENPNLKISDYSSWLLLNTPLWVYLLVTNIIIFFYLTFKKKNIQISPLLLVLPFIIFQFTNIYQTDYLYFWTSVPDSITYKQLGLTFFECGKLAIDCISEPLLQWPPGQPILSGLLALFFDEIASYIYILFFSYATYIIFKLTYERTNNFSLLGVFLFYIFHNNFDLTPFIISEVPYAFFTIFGIYYLKKQNFNLSFIFLLLSFFVRPIGIVNLLIFFIFLFLRKRELLNKFLLYLLASIFLIMSYNYFLNNQFIFSTTLSTNIEQGEMLRDFEDRDLSNIEYLTELTNNNNYHQVLDNISRLYGEGSRSCDFSYCFLYNPLYNNQGNIPTLLDESMLGSIIKPLLEILFAIGAPLGLWVYLPFLSIFSIAKNDLFSNLLFLIFILNILLSSLTFEYGSRWWLLPNLMLIYLIPLSIKNLKHIIPK
tara:strand:- start:2158 stop:3516 length:1359 start_codon:yes stop_codon:yes gene_type:complete